MVNDVFMPNTFRLIGLHQKSSPLGIGVILDEVKPAMFHLTVVDPVSKSSL